MTKLQELQLSGEAPSWMEESGFKTLSSGYLLAGETPKGMWTRVSQASAKALGKPELADKFFDLFWKGWLCGASPVLSNMGTDRGLPISCFSLQPADSTDSILNKAHELAMLSKHGGGVGIYAGDIRAAGSPISSGGTTEGVVPFLKIYDSVITGISQGNVRRGAAAVYLPVRHGDAEAFLRIRRPEGDPNRQCLNLHHGISLTDEFIKSALSGDPKDSHMLSEIYKARMETGEPYLFFHDNVQKNRPQCYKDLGLPVVTSNICLSEDTLVVTDKGLKHIKDLVGQTVKIFDGKNWVTNSNFRRTSNLAPLFRIRLSDGSCVDATAEHKWLAVQPDVRMSEGVPQLTRTKDLLPGHKITFHFEESHGDVRLISAYAKGFLVAEGTRMQKSQVSEEYRPLLWLYDPKLICWARLKSSIEETLPDLSEFRSDVISEVSFYTKDGDNSGRSKVNGLSVRPGLLDYCTKYKHQLPSDWITWDKYSKLEFLAGLLDGDGCFMKNGGGYQIASISKTLLSDIQALMKTLGLKVTLSKMRDAGVADFKDGYGEYPTQEAWRLTLSSFFAYRLSQDIRFERLPAYSLKKPNRFCANFSKVLSVERIGEGPTYCTNVPSTSQFALANGLMSGNCTEILLYTDAEHTFVCDLSSLNVTKWDEWKNTDAVYLTAWFLEGVMTEFLTKAKHMKGFECAVRFAEKGRPIGIGVLGFHTLLQSEMSSMDSFRAKILNKAIFKHIKENALRASQDMAKEFGEPEWCKGYGVRHSHLLAVAPTSSNSTISGNVSAGIEPLNANAYSKRSAKGIFLEYNPTLKILLQAKGRDSEEVWKSITGNSGSVAHLDFLSKEEKDVFKTAFEIDQRALIDLAADRQPFICQGQSLNLFFSADVDPQYFHEVHLQAWEKGLNSLYYVRSSSVLKADLSSRGETENCKACEG